jgi:hypothetical protein
LLPVGEDQIYRPETAAEAATDVRQMATRHPDLIKLWLDDLLGTAPKLKPEIYRTPTFKQAVATNEQNLKTLYEAGVKIGFVRIPERSPCAYPALPSIANYNSWCKAGSHRFRR